MPVSSSFKRTFATFDSETTTEYVTATLNSAYAAGGFTTNPFLIEGEPGSSPYPGRTVLSVQWFSPSGFTYVSTVVGSVMTTKILTAPTVEFTNGTAVPENTVHLVIVKAKI